MDIRLVNRTLPLLLGLALFSTQAVALEAQSRLLFAQGSTGQLVLIDPVSEQTTRIIVGPITHGVDVAPDGRRAYAASFGSDAITIVDLTQPRAVGTVPVGGKSHHITVSPDGRWVYIAVGSTNAVAVVDTRTDLLTATIPLG